MRTATQEEVKATVEMGAAWNKIGIWGESMDDSRTVENHCPWRMGRNNLGRTYSLSRLSMVMFLEDRE